MPVLTRTLVGACDLTLCAQKKIRPFPLFLFRSPCSGKILAHLHDFSMIFAMDKFLPFVDLFQSKDGIKIEVQ